MPDTLTQGQRIKQMRLECRFTQEYVAAQLATTKQAIYKYEADLIKNIPSDKLLQLSQLLRCSPSWLQGFTEERGAPLGGTFEPVDAPCGTPHYGKTVTTPDDQFAFYRDLMDAMTHLTPAERQSVLQFAHFLASKHPE
ncbi:MAG: helix-turn-helix transcriptional regulator [Faecalibacterium sp.]